MYEDSKIKLYKSRAVVYTIILTLTKLGNSIKVRDNIEKLSTNRVSGNTQVNLRSHTTYKQLYSNYRIRRINQTVK